MIKAETGKCQELLTDPFGWLPNVLPKLFPCITFSHDGLGQTLSAVAAVGFLGHFEDEFSHAPKSKLPMPEQQVQARQMSADAVGGREKVNFRQNASSAQKIG